VAGSWLGGEKQKKGTEAAGKTKEEKALYVIPQSDDIHILLVLESIFIYLI
jgi:hypothetical protein